MLGVRSQKGTKKEWEGLVKCLHKKKMAQNTGKEKLRRGRTTNSRKKHERGKGLNANSR